MCPECRTAVQGNYLLPALSRLGSDDQQFALAFILRSGSLKEMARLYGVSYPTVRNRLDDVIARLSAITESDETGAADDREDGADAAGDDTDAAGENAYTAGVDADGAGGDADATRNDE